MLNQNTNDSSIEFVENSHLQNVQNPSLVHMASFGNDMVEYSQEKNNQSTGNVTLLDESILLT